MTTPVSFQDTIEGYERAVAACGAIMHNAELPMGVRLAAYKTRIDWCAEYGDYTECKRLASAGTALGAAELGADDPAVLVLRNSEAYWMCVLGFSDAASDRFPALIADIERVLGRDSELAFAARNNSAMPHKSAGRWDRAARVYRGVLADMEATASPDDVLLLTARDNLAEALGADGRFEESTRLYEANIDVMAGMWASGDWRILRVRDAIARNWWMAGEHGRAIGLWMVLAKDARTHMGEDDPFTAECRLTLAGAQYAMEEWEEALRWAEAAASALPAEWGPDERASVEAFVEDCRRAARR